MRITLAVGGKEYRLRTPLSEPEAKAIEEKVQAEIEKAAAKKLSPPELLILVALNLTQELMELEAEYEQVLEFVTQKEQS